ncbi:hypothetical protein O2N63_15735 [Aliiroseovarius sp. KMU-50]|uniref:Flp family type IVb pilin n=1 Tax=Aliiroseovarius salicola TaxID=3009082 RepID=A0ABT4W4Z3_9RHOB|nr:hypothetical protein [Aliiroseovarius sp. KMU-50]MDA5095540.1 hypothetical protein [Aliiroseovarius sp. KMU-50]
MKIFKTGFIKSEQGVASTEYLILLGMLTAVVVVAVLAMSGALGDSWMSWAAWFSPEEGNLSSPPG